ncbi:hypothetical protein [Methylobacterium sp. WSM2598]|uniref:hypothetical protein n=1 Tax=Methylobacterium sp. WSM2598 TaxID=398261 RepID=UPI0003618D7F|nr:hypothetical protein [Methylobacterium sp. WSM2598]
MTDPALRRVLAVDDALTWVYEELRRPRAARLRGPAGYGTSAAGFAPGVRVDVSRKIVDHAPDGPHPDALLIETAIAALDPAALDVSDYAITVGLAPGVDLDGALEVARRDLAVTIVRAAQSGRAPDWGGPPEFEPALAANGKPALWECVQEHHGELPDGTPLTTASHVVSKMARVPDRYVGKFCKLKWTRGAADVLADRAAYAIWHGALSRLTDTVELGSIQLTVPRAEPAPWLPSSPPLWRKGSQDAPSIRRTPRNIRNSA